MGLKADEHVFAGEQVDIAEKHFGCKLAGYVEACALAYDTVQPPIMEKVGKQPLPWLLNTLFAAGFIMGSLFAQGKGEQAMKWLAKQRPGLGDG